MTWPEGSAPERTEKRLDPTARTILIVWAIAVLALAAFGVFSSRNLDGWESLVAAIYIAFAVVAVVAIGLSALLIRGLFATRTSQIAAAVVGPPVVATVIFVILMALG
jgi:hypothetical protein